MKKIKSFKLFNEATDNPFDDDYIRPTFDDRVSLKYTDDEEADVDLPKEDISFEGAKAWILENYDEEKVIEMKDEKIHEYVDIEQMEHEGYESEYDYYVDYGRGEAESDVIRGILTHLKSRFNLTFDEYDEETNLYQFLKDVFEPLNY